MENVEFARFDEVLDGLRIRASLGVQQEAHRVMELPMETVNVARNRSRTLAMLYNARVKFGKGDAFRTYVLELDWGKATVVLYGRVDNGWFLATSMKEVAE